MGIAGEDDLDAPDIHETNGSSRGSAGHLVNPSGAPGQSRLPSRSAGNGYARAAMKGGSVAVLDADQSAILRDRLLGEITDIASADLAANWARGVLTAKNSLTATDAKLVEDAFEQRLLRFSGLNGVGDLSEGDVVAAPNAVISRKTRRTAAPDHSNGIDKSVLAVGAPRRYRNKDEFTIPLCRVHGAVHRSTDECAWWKAARIDPVKIARKLWKRTRLNQTVASASGSTQYDEPKPDPGMAADA